jgi:hypothetical protein
MIEGAEYLVRLSSVSRLFDFAGEAIEEFGKNEKLSRRYVEGVLNRYWNKKYGDDRATQERLGVSKGDPLPSHLMDKLVPAVHDLVPKRIEDVSNLLRQNQLVTLSAHFETFMKDIHRAVLIARPQFLRTDRTVPLGKLISKDRKEILEEEIEREVHALDRKNINQRAEYFRDHLRLSWETRESIPEWCSQDMGAVAQIERLLGLRNGILHEKPLVEVSVQDLLLAFCFFLLVPLACCIRGNELYPESFSPVLEEVPAPPAPQKSF